MAIPKEGYFKPEQGRYGPIFPKTPANYGFTIIAKIKPGREDVIRAYGKKIEGAIAGDPFVLAPLKLHYLRWVLFNIGGDTYFMYQGIFDTDFDKYTEDAITLFKQTGVDTVFENLEGFPMDWKTNAPAFVKFVREHQCPSFLEYGEYPFVTADEIKKALKVKASLLTTLLLWRCDLDRYTCPASGAFHHCRYLRSGVCGSSRYNGTNGSRAPVLAEELCDIDVQYVWRFLRNQKIDLKARKSWCESNDPDFASKAADVVGLYIDPPGKAIVLCVDEKPSIQALERAQGYLKLPTGRALTGQSHDYKRHGTTTLLRLSMSRPARFWVSTKSGAGASNSLASWTRSLQPFPTASFTSC